MKVLIYARYSPRPEDDETKPEQAKTRKRHRDKCLSNKVQIAYCREWATRNGHEVVGEPFTDESVSGDIEQRVGLWEAMNHLKKGMGFVVYKLDRLARDLYLSLILEHDIKAKGACLFSATGEGTWEDTEQNTLLRNIIASVAAYERAVIGARTAAAMRRHQHNGLRMSPNCPYGWQHDPDNPAGMIPHERERKMVLRVLELQDKGLGLRKTSRILAEEGYLARCGKPLDVTTLTQIRKHWAGCEKELTTW